MQCILYILTMANSSATCIVLSGIDLSYSFDHAICVLPALTFGYNPDLARLACLNPLCLMSDSLILCWTLAVVAVDHVEGRHLGVLYSKD